MTQNSKFIIVVLILLIGIMVNHYFSKPDISLPRKSLTEFPKTLGDWTAINDQKIDEQSMKILQVDDYIMRNYRNSIGETVGLYIGYFKSQREGKGIHSPRQCLPGAGWVPVNATVLQIAMPDNNPRGVYVNKYLMEKGLNKELYLFWYHGRDRIYASEYLNKIYLIWDGLAKKRTDGALIRVNTPIVRSTSETLKTQYEFIKLFFPLLKEFIPN
jgi:EpsI family protein